MRLRQLRYDGILSWKVPAIISLLPLAVQLSVLLFFFGLLLLLRSLDHVVTDNFTVIGGVLFSLFVVTIPLPLVFPACPYKTPLLPTILTLWNFTVAPAIITAAAAVFAVIICLCAGPLLIFSHVRPSIRHTQTLMAWNAKLSYHVKQTRVHLGELVRFLFFDNSPHIFW